MKQQFRYAEQNSAIMIFFLIYTEHKKKREREEILR